MRGGIIIITLPPHTYTQPTKHHWCDKNFTSLRNFIYSVDIRLWLKTIKRERDALNSICKSNPYIYHVEAKGTGWLTACCPPGTLALSLQWWHVKHFHNLLFLFFQCIFFNSCRSVFLLFFLSFIISPLQPPFICISFININEEDEAANVFSLIFYALRIFRKRGAKIYPKDQFTWCCAQSRESMSQQTTAKYSISYCWK